MFMWVLKAGFVWGVTSKKNNKNPDYLESSRIIKHGIIITQILVN